MKSTNTPAYDPMPASADQDEISAWADRYLARHGLPPIAGGNGEGENAGTGEGGSGTGSGEGGQGTGTGEAGSGQGDNGNGGQAGTSTDDPADPSTWDPDRARATILAQRRSEEAAKAEAKAAREEVDRLKREAMSESDRIKADNEQLKKDKEAADRQVREARLEAKLAVRTDVADAELVTEQLLRRGLTFDDQGQPLDLDTQLNALFDAKPVLKRTQGEMPDPANGDGGTNGNGGNAGAGGGTGNGGGQAQGAGPGTNAGAGGGGQGAPPQLTAAEVAQANEAGLTPEQFQGFKEARSIEEMAAANQAQQGD